MLQSRRFVEKPSGKLVSEKFKETRPSGRQAVCGSEAGEVIGKEVVRNGDTRYRSQKNQSFKRHFTHTRTHMRAHTQAAPQSCTGLSMYIPVTCPRR